MFIVDIDITATTWEEIEMALDEVKRKISENYSGGNDSREDNITTYMYAVTGEESPFIECRHCQGNVYYEDTKPTMCDSCGKDL